MGKTDNYKYIDEIDISNAKENKFSHRKIHNKKDFDNWYETEASEYNKTQDDFIFRGVNEAKFKLYNSLQRAWWNYDFVRALFQPINDSSNYIKFLKVLLEKSRSWNNNLLDRYYKELNFELNDLALLSLMQHNGLPTPLLDFTTDLNIALYFSLSGMKQIPSNNLIDNFVSIYILNKRQKSFLDVSDIFKEEGVQDISIDKLFEKGKLIYFSDLKQIRNSQEGINTNINIHSNLNILNQKGLFVFNHHPWKPIEMSSSSLSQTYIKEVICVDIHKSLKEYILHKLKKDNSILNDQYLFPSFNDLKEVTLKEIMREFSPS